MEHIELQKLIQGRLEKECPNTLITYLGKYKGQLTFSLEEEPDDEDGYFISGYPVFALVSPDDLEHVRLVSDLDFEITDYFLALRQSKAAQTKTES